jgi:adenylyl-sulfate kinase
MLLVIGLDSMPASLLSSEFVNELPNIRKILDLGVYCTLESCHPPITIPAWMVMMSSKSPGRLGVYGFKHRKAYSYTEGWIANSQSIKEPLIWDYLEKENKKVCLIGVPPTYPPIRVNGNLISCFITPKQSKDFAYPSKLMSEVEKLVGGNYRFDVQFRIEDRDKIIRDLYEMTEKRFTVIKHLLIKTEWDYFMFVEIGVDRLHHMFWKYYDRTHPKYESNNKYEKVIPEYYRYVDAKIGELLSVVDDETYILVVSDHGTSSMKGAFCINEWLIKEGYLVLKKYPDSLTELDKCEVDWDRTIAWGWGGYYARIFLNVKGRESRGKIKPSEYDQIRVDLKARLASIRGPQNEELDNKIFFPDELYDESNGSKPDLMVYFDNLSWRSAGTVGHNTLYLSENDTGPDDSVHSMDGIFLLYNKKNRNQGRIRIDRISIYDVAPTLMHIMDMNVPSDMQGKVIYEISNWARSRSDTTAHISQPIEKKYEKRKNNDQMHIRTPTTPVIWLTGLPGSGKTTIAKALHPRLKESGFKVELLDGDTVRKEISPELGFTKQDREIHARRVVYLSKLLSRNGIIPIVSLISPYRDFRNLAREEINNLSGSKFIEVYVKCSLDTCMRRDPKGLYKKALLGEIKDLTGLQDPYEEPLNPEVVVNTDYETLYESAAKIVSELTAMGSIEQLQEDISQL